MKLRSCEIFSFYSFRHSDLFSQKKWMGDNRSWNFQRKALPLLDVSIKTSQSVWPFTHCWCSQNSPTYQLCNTRFKGRYYTLKIYSHALFLLTLYLRKLTYEKLNTVTWYTCNCCFPETALNINHVNAFILCRKLSTLKETFESHIYKET